MNTHHPSTGEPFIRFMKDGSGITESNQKRAGKLAGIPRCTAQRMLQAYIKETLTGKNPLTDTEMANATGWARSTIMENRRRIGLKPHLKPRKKRISKQAGKAIGPAWGYAN